MELKVTRESKALTPLIWKNVPPLAVICGVNGAGKSQLLAALAQISNTNATLSDFPISQSEVLHFRAAWTLDKAKAFGADWLSSQRQAAWTVYKNEKQQNPVRDQMATIFRRIEKQLNLAKGDLSHGQLMNALTDQDLLSAAPGTLEQASELFAKRQAELVDQKLKGEDVHSTAHPWLLLNSLLESAGLRYRCTSPRLDTIRHPFLLEFKLENSEAVVDPNEMSSGEKVILKLFLLLFAANFQGKLPKLLLLDEPDAHLHPEMVRKFIRTLDGVLVKQHDVRVLMTTHSPTTVAVCPEESLFEMQPVGSSGERIRRISRDRAIGLLTAGVPSLRVHAENRRQVFVESEADERVYSALILHLSTFLDREIALSFIASGRKDTQDGTGCSQVKNLVERLNAAENPSVYGIVDWDGKQEPEGQVRVLARGTRYAIENCVFDPLVLVAFLLKHRLLSKEDVGLDAIPRFLDLGQIDAHTWQSLVDHVTGKIQAAAAAQAGHRSNATPIAGPEVTLDTWHLTVRGHDLEEHVLSAFPALNRFSGGKAGEFMVQVVEHIGPEMPGLFPQALLDIFTSIQRSGV